MQLTAGSVIHFRAPCFRLICQEYSILELIMMTRRSRSLFGLLHHSQVEQARW
jgi:hypothetical protein